MSAFMERVAPVVDATIAAFAERDLSKTRWRQAVTRHIISGRGAWR